MWLSEEKVGAPHVEFTCGDFDFITPKFLFANWIDRDAKTQDLPMLVAAKVCATGAGAPLPSSEATRREAVESA